MERSLSQALIFCLALGAGAASADELRRDSDRDRSGSSDVMYNAIGLSRVSTGFRNVDDAVSLDSVLGFRIPDQQWFGLELNLGFTLIPGETTPCGGVFGDPCASDETRSTQDFQAVNLGVFGVLRSPGRFYGTGRLGYRYINSNLPELDENRSGSAWGAGAGYRYNPEGGYVELLYTRLSGDVDLLGLSFGFGFGGRR